MHGRLPRVKEKCSIDIIRCVFLTLRYDGVRFFVDFTQRIFPFIWTMAVLTAIEINLPTIAMDMWCQFLLLELNSFALEIRCNQFNWKKFDFDLLGGQILAATPFLVHFKMCARFPLSNIESIQWILFQRFDFSHLSLMDSFDFGYHRNFDLFFRERQRPEPKPISNAWTLQWTIRFTQVIVISWIFYFWIWLISLNIDCWIDGSNRAGDLKGIGKWARNN